MSRLDTGGRIDRARPLSFSFDGRRYRGFAGDTLASALLANGVHLVGRSFKYHRPRGIMTAGAEEPSALIQLERPGGRSDPNLRATEIELYDGLTAESQNRWPSLGFDVGATGDLLSPFLPAGFYYKTFLWPASWWTKVYEPFIRRAAGLGRSPTLPDPDRYLHRHAHCDVLVVGAGPAGLMAALAAGRTGARVILAEREAELGGSLLGESGALADFDGRAGDSWLQAVVAELASMPDVTVLRRTNAFGYLDHNYLVLHERVTDHLPLPPANLPRQRLWRVRAKQVVLCTGAIERPLVFHGNDRPGVMLASAARAYLNRFAVRPGSRAVVFTNNDSAYAAALDLFGAGVAIEAIVDLRARPDGPLPAAAAAAGLPIRRGAAVVGTGGPALRLPPCLGRLESHRPFVLAVAGPAALRRSRGCVRPRPIVPSGAFGGRRERQLRLGQMLRRGRQCRYRSGTRRRLRRFHSRCSQGPRAGPGGAPADLGRAQPCRTQPH
jgi:sarcosine oxidase, subunit alpha